MASTFPSHVTSPHCTDDHHDYLTRSPCINSSRHFALDIPNPYSTIQLIRSFIATTAHHCSNDISYPFMNPRRIALLDS
jgi:hypothetical protein